MAGWYQKIAESSRRADQHRPRRPPLRDWSTSWWSFPPRARLKAGSECKHGTVLLHSIFFTRNRKHLQMPVRYLLCHSFVPHLAHGEDSRVWLSLEHILRLLGRAYLRPYQFSASQCFPDAASKTAPLRSSLKSLPVCLSSFSRNAANCLCYRYRYL